MQMGHSNTATPMATLIRTKEAGMATVGTETVEVHSNSDSLPTTVVDETIVASAPTSIDTISMATR